MPANQVAEGTVDAEEFQDGDILSNELETVKETVIEPTEGPSMETNTDDLPDIGSTRKKRFNILHPRIPRLFPGQNRFIQN